MAWSSQRLLSKRWRLYSLVEFHNCHGRVDVFAKSCVFFRSMVSL
ncbi:MULTISPECIES: hypothetical protein [Candidatus Ichthyocystis]|nr:MULTISPECIES: hypothetical protein [Ichthyocystis]